MTHQEAIDTLASERYLLDDMSGEDRLAFEEHYFSCEACAGDLRTAAAMLEGARRGFAARPDPRAVPGTNRRPLRARNWYRSAALPWAVAATLAGVTVYQSVRVVPSLQPDASPVALAPVTLRPASRGAEALVAFDSQSRFVTVALDINDAPQSAELTFSLATADGRPVASGRAAAPAAGAPLLLLLPSSTLTAPMHYILSVRDTGSPARIVGAYRFALTPR
ncbi:MAG TPA: zf-HC2 domain-containing protein [Vicinamibacterales bacterium]|nr:zf-HC2 domain-containing protein [Vicinamibacterales bacterium]